MRHKSHMTNFGRLRNPPQKEEEYSAEEKKKIKEKPPQNYIFWQEGFCWALGKAAKANLSELGGIWGRKGLSWGCLKPSFSQESRTALSGRQSRQTESFDLWELFAGQMRSEKHKQRSSSAPASSSVTCY